MKAGAYSDISLLFQADPVTSLRCSCANLAAMPEVTCNGPCNNAWRRARNAWQEAMALYDPLDPSQSRPPPPDLQPSYGSPWCGRCQAVIAAQLAELDDLAPLRSMAADGHSGDTSPQQNRGRSEPPSPSPAGDDMDDVYRMLQGWEDAYRDLNGWRSHPRRGLLADKRTTCVGWLADHLPSILTSPLAADFGREVMEWHRALKNAAKAGQRRLTKPMRCPRCHLVMLTWLEGDEDVTCANPACGLIMRYDEYQAELDRMAEAIKRGEEVALIA